MKRTKPNIKIDKEFGDRLNKLLINLKKKAKNRDDKKKFTKEKIAEHLKLSGTMVSQYINGKHAMSYSRLYHLIHYLSLTPNDIAYLFNINNLKDIKGNEFNHTSTISLLNHPDVKNYYSIIEDVYIINDDKIKIELEFSFHAGVG
ncbi:MAG: helix-turn-helix domain-containing protein, partial [Deltaproteobacteria bacterium]|nr:helix-turn-helix domain-containing protein [Deltaproteobacteria bacterium]